MVAKPWWGRTTNPKLVFFKHLLFILLFSGLLVGIHLFHQHTNHLITDCRPYIAHMLQYRSELRSIQNTIAVEVKTCKSGRLGVPRWDHRMTPGWAYPNVFICLLLVCWFACLIVSFFVCLFVCLVGCLVVWLVVCLPVCLFVFAKAFFRQLVQGWQCKTKGGSDRYQSSPSTVVTTTWDVNSKKGTNCMIQLDLL